MLSLLSRSRSHSIIFISLICLAIAPFTAKAASFPDVPENTVNYNAVEYLKQKGVIAGYPDGTFQPDKTINRAEALKIVLLASGTKTDSTTKLAFPDVAASDWFYPYVQKAFDLGIVKGYDDGKFKAANNINVAESMKMIFLSFQATLPTQLTDDPYPDVTKDLWYAAYAQYGKSKQLISTLDDGNLHADREIKRGEYANIIYRLMYVQDKNLDKFPLSTDWPVYTHPTDHYSIKVPFGWQKFEVGGQTIFWKQDSADNQLSFGRIFPNSAIVVSTTDKNIAAVPFDDYINNLKYNANGTVQKLTLNNYPFAAISFSGKNQYDYYFELPDKTILAVYTEVGTGLNQPHLLDDIRSMIGSIRYSETSSAQSRDELLSLVRAKILVPNAGQEAIGLFKEIILIETDTVGIGTGPIDYYYSSDYDVTLKYERNSNTLLQIHDGRTSSF